jgi:hypothetical protein
MHIPVEEVAADEQQQILGAPRKLPVEGQDDRQEREEFEALEGYGRTLP